MRERRIMVYGVTGSGKTTLAARISEATGVPWTSVDDLTWEPGWVAVDPAEQRRRIVEICARDEWLLDTAYGIWLEVPLARVELIVALDYPRWLSLARLVRRTVLRAVDQRSICNGNTESWREIFSKDSIIVWHFRSFRRKQERIAEWVSPTTTAGNEVGSRASRPRVVRLRTARQTEAWLASLRTSPGR